MPVEETVMSAVAASTSSGASAIASSDWPEQGQWTYEDYCRLPDDGWRYEVIRGALYMAPAPKPKHQFSLGQLHLAFRRFIDPRRLGAVLFAPIDVKLPGLASPVQPDLLFLREEHLDRIREECVDGVPDLIVEVLSPSNWIVDRREKYEVYAAAGVEEYWIVDPKERTIEVFVLEGESYTLCDRKGPGETIGSRLLQGLEIAIDDVFLIR